ncbi:MAG TPA: J domain-containing protein [Candidatus Limnocylindrales bacterium]|jgi:curved DNA-binding protein|nr:J domain-containing protein [Candidatus Limnocylindrales bacterium]
MEYKDYYAVLGVPRTATQADIKKAFRKLARKHHPDTSGGDPAAEQRFKEINEANAVLSDTDKRVLYDRLGADWESYARAPAGAAGQRAGGAGPFAGYGGAGAAPGGGNVRYEFHTTGDAGDFSDFFQAFFGGASEPIRETGDGPGRGRRSTGGASFEDILAGMGLNADLGGGTAAAAGRSAGSRRPAPKPPNAEAIAEISLDEAYHGTTRLVDIDGKRLEVTIPRGADTGTRIRLTGKGPGGGDLYVVVRQRPDPVFTRRGADLERDVPLSLEEALIGADVRVRTPKGRVLLKIPAGTQPGRVFRLREQGMPRFRADGHGDLFAKARVVLPTHLSTEAEAAARRFLDVVKQPDPRTNEAD